VSLVLRFNLIVVNGLFMVGWTFHNEIVLRSTHSTFLMLIDGLTDVGYRTAIDIQIII